MRRNPEKVDQAGRRRGLLAAIHVAKKDLDLDDATYRDLLTAEFGVNSAAGLSIAQMKRLLALFSSWGWRSPKGRQAAALRDRARDIASRIRNGEERLQSLTLKFCGVTRLEWAHDEGKLTRLLKVLGEIERGEV